MSLAMKFYEPEPGYLRSLDSLLRVGTTKPDYLLDGARQLIAKSQQASDLTQRNRFVFDALSLVNGKWDRAQHPDPFDRAALQSLIAALQRGESGVVGVAMLIEAAEHASQTTWASFEDFAGSEQGRRQFDLDQEQGLTDFASWFRLYKPYLVVDVQENAEAAEREIQRRIEWMVAKIAPSRENDPFGVREHYIDEAWYYAREKYFAAQERREMGNTKIDDLPEINLESQV